MPYTELLIRGFLSLVGSVGIYFFHHQSPVLHLLIILVFIEYISFVTVKIASSTFSCKDSYIHIARKIIVFAFVAIAHYLDLILELNQILKNMTIIFYIINELLATITHAEKLGVPVPKIIKEALEKLRRSLMSGKK